WRTEGKHKGLRSVRIWLRGLAANRLARGPGMTCETLDERQHLLRIRLPNDLKQGRLRGNVGQPTKVADLDGHVVQRQRFSDRRPRLPELPRHVLVGVGAAMRQLLKRLGL